MNKLIIMKSKINVKDLLNSESEVLERLSREVADQDVIEVITGHSSSTSGHRSGSSHSSHSSAMREKI